MRAATGMVHGCLYSIAFWLVVLLLVLVLGGCATDYPPPPSCEQTANRELCELEQRINRIENRARASRLCRRVHGADSIICN